jgi:hypothetical protein
VLILVLVRAVIHRSTPVFGLAEILPTSMCESVNRVALWSMPNPVFGSF